MDVSRSVLHWYIPIRPHFNTVNRAASPHMIRLQCLRFPTKSQSKMEGLTVLTANVVYRAVFDETECRFIASTLQSSTCPENMRERYPVCYIGCFGDNSDVAIDGFDGALKLLDYMNSQLSKHDVQLHGMSSWQIENALHDKFMDCGIWTSLIHPLKAIKENNPKPIPPQNRKFRRKPKIHRIAFRAIKREENNSQDMPEDSGDYQHKVSKPYQSDVAPLRSYLEYNYSERKPNTIPAKTISTISEKAAQQWLDKALKQIVEDTAKPETMENIGFGSFQHCKMLASWVSEKYGIQARIQQITIAENENGLYPILVNSGLTAKTKKSIKSKLASIVKKNPIKKVRVRC
jgi:hypothetical protein